MAAQQKPDFRLNYLDRNLRKLTFGGLITMFTILAVSIYLLPFGYMLVTSVKSREQIARNTILPLTQLTYTYEGEALPDYRIRSGDEFQVYVLPAESGDQQVIQLREAQADEPNILLDLSTFGVFEWDGDISQLEHGQQVVEWTYREADNLELGLQRSKKYPTFNVETDNGIETWALIRSPENVFVNIDRPFDPVIKNSLDISTLEIVPAVAEVEILYNNRPTDFELYEAETGEDLWAYLPAANEDEEGAVFIFDAEAQALGEAVEWTGDIATLQQIDAEAVYAYGGRANEDIGLERRGVYPIYQVPIEDGFQELALVRTGTPNIFVDHNNEDAVVEWTGDVDSLAVVYEQYEWKQVRATDYANGYQRDRLYPVYYVETEDGIQRLALVRQGTLTDESIFARNLEAEEPEIFTSTTDLTTIESVLENYIYVHFGSPVPEWSVAPGDKLLRFISPDDSDQEWALVAGFNIDTGRDSVWIDPDDPDTGIFFWGERYYASLDSVDEIDPNWSNYPDAWEQIDFPLMLFNTAFIAFVGGFGTLVSCTIVAYGFARFPIPGKNILFLVLIATIVLPRQVTLVPTYAFFSRINWTNTWLPLIVPHFFANAYNVFLLRQFIQTIPREMDEAAMIDGAGPMTILRKIIVPQAWPALVAAGLFHLVFAWNDYFEPLIYTLGNEDIQPISVGVQQFNFIYNERPEFIQATSLMALVLPVLIFMFSQRYFMRGVVITGVDK